MTARIFLSYGDSDRDYAERLRNSLTSSGVDVIDPVTAHESGPEWAEEVRVHLENSDAVLLVVPESGSRHANNAVFEAGAGHALGKTVLGVLPDSSSTRELPKSVVDVPLTDGRQPVDQIASEVVRLLSVESAA